MNEVSLYISSTGSQYARWVSAICIQVHREIRAALHQGALEIREQLASRGQISNTRLRNTTATYEAQYKEANRQV
jgi:hypothetical protein